MYVRPLVSPFISTAEMIKKFQSGTRENSLPCMRNSTSNVSIGTFLVQWIKFPRQHFWSTFITQGDSTGQAQRKPKLTLTRPKEPEFETAQRVRPTRVKSSAELEEEMMAKIPKFKAHPVNKKVAHVTQYLAINFGSSTTAFWWWNFSYDRYRPTLFCCTFCDNRFWKLQLNHYYYLKAHPNFQNLRYGIVIPKELRAKFAYQDSLYNIFT